MCIVVQSLTTGQRLLSHGMSKMTSNPWSGNEKKSIVTCRSWRWRGTAGYSWSLSRVAPFATLTEKGLIRFASRPSPAAKSCLTKFRDAPLSTNATAECPTTRARNRIAVGPPTPTSTASEAAAAVGPAAEIASRCSRASGGGAISDGEFSWGSSEEWDPGCGDAIGGSPLGGLNFQQPHHLTELLPGVVEFPGSEVG
ncbi:unnamed protein product [Linum trigynum]|uniref:Uncharacterized protein n=1 Tax=Linum trigynum TaxID=586398 RepID=A0AAV2EAZ9_9ROSI